MALKESVRELPWYKILALIPLWLLMLPLLAVLFLIFVPPVALFFFLAEPHRRTALLSQHVERWPHTQRTPPPSAARDW